jgi:energy-coupling factor transport system permease protein
LRFLPQFAEELHVIRIAQLSRGAKLATSPTRSGIAGLTSLLVPLFASAFRHADTLASAMDARCYHGAQGRTRLNPLSFAKRDAIAIALLIALAAVTIAVSQAL